MRRPPPAAAHRLRADAPPGLPPVPSPLCSTSWPDPAPSLPPSRSKVTVLGAGGGIGQPLSLLLKMNRLVSELSLYDVANVAGVAADLSHCNTPTQARWGRRRCGAAVGPLAKGCWAAQQGAGMAAHATLPEQAAAVRCAAASVQAAAAAGDTAAVPLLLLLRCVHSSPALLRAIYLQVKGFTGSEELAAALKGAELVVIPAGALTTHSSTPCVLGSNCLVDLHCGNRLLAVLGMTCLVDPRCRSRLLATPAAGRSSCRCAAATASSNPALPPPLTSAGVPRKPGMTRDDLFNINAGQCGWCWDASRRICSRICRLSSLVFHQPACSCAPLCCLPAAACPCTKATHAQRCHTFHAGIVKTLVEACAQHCPGAILNIIRCGGGW